MQNIQLSSSLGVSGFGVSGNTMYERQGLAPAQNVCTGGADSTAHRHRHNFDALAALKIFFNMNDMEGGRSRSQATCMHKKVQGSNSSSLDH